MNSLHSYSMEKTEMLHVKRRNSQKEPPYISLEALEIAQATILVRFIPFHGY